MRKVGEGKLGTTYETLGADEVTTFGGGKMTI